MGLARGFDPTVDLRLQAASEAAAQMPSDVVCLQEVWTQEDLDVVKFLQLAQGFHVMKQVLFN